MWLKHMKLTFLWVKTFAFWHFYKVQPNNLSSIISLGPPTSQDNLSSLHRDALVWKAQCLL